MKVTNQNLIVFEGGSAKGITFSRKIKIGKEMATQSFTGSGTGGLNSHHPIFRDEKNEEHIHRDGAFIKVSGSDLNIKGRETVNRG